VTPMPRSSHPGNVTTASRRRFKSLFATWYASCWFIGCTGCVYYGPIDVQTEDNKPPNILSWTDGTVYCDDQNVDPETLCFVLDEQQVFVTADDEDGDVLDFFWEGSVSGPIGDAMPISGNDIQGSQVFLLKADVVDREELRCTVSDGSDDRTTRKWQISVL
jgi:hypothetical protein